MNTLIIQKDEKQACHIQVWSDAHASRFVQYLEQYNPWGLNVSRFTGPSHTNTKTQKVTNCSGTFCVHIGLLGLQVKCKWTWSFILDPKISALEI